MGCSESKSTGTDDQNKPGEKGGQSGDSVWVTVQEAVEYVQCELGVPESKAKQIVNCVNKNGDGKVSNNELIRLWERVKAVKEQLYEIFKEFDKDKSGFVTATEASGVLRHKFEGVEEKHLKAMVNRYDENQDGKIKYDEFIYFYAFIDAKKDELKDMFAELDKDKSGTLDAEEITQGLVKHCALEEKQARSLVEDFDNNKDGKINKDEFNSLWLKLFP